jgi:hypothetical protein
MRWMWLRDAVSVPESTSLTNEQLAVLESEIPTCQPINCKIIAFKLGPTSGGDRSCYEN